jgi:thymidylate synthase
MEINVATISEAWEHLLLGVLTQGMRTQVTADGVTRDTIEYPGVIITNISKPYMEMIPKGSKFTESSLTTYAAQLWDGDAKGFVYSYGERLRAYKATVNSDPIDQILSIVEDLKLEPQSRREVAITWQPTKDLYTNVVPCMILTDFKLRNLQLNLTVYFRSHDIYGAFPANAYGLVKMLGKVANLMNRAVDIGRLTIISNGAHIYEYDVANAKQIAGIMA